MFERYTERARHVVVLAQEDTRILNHTWIGTEHILLGPCMRARAWPRRY
jgi:ATP-dependent Clp protease ATP-binding subunit ClpC